MHKEPLVSIITPFFNTPPRFMQESIESVLAQSYGNWELLLVDDGSTDLSSNQARQYAARFPNNVRYLEHTAHQNRGISASRNLGLREAKGEYVAFLDADDVWFPQKLERQASIMISQPDAAMVYGITQYWHSWNGKGHDKQRDYIQQHRLQGEMLIQPPMLLTLFLQGKAAVPCISSILARRAFLNSIGQFEECFRGMYEDQVFYAKVCLRAPVFVSNECWDKYRQHPGSVCSVAADSGCVHSTRVAYLHWLQSYLLAEGFEGTELWHVLRKELNYYDNPNSLSVGNVVQYLARRARKLWSRIAAQPLSVNRRR